MLLAAVTNPSHDWAENCKACYSIFSLDACRSIVVEKVATQKKVTTQIDANACYPKAFPSQNAILQAKKCHSTFGHVVGFFAEVVKNCYVATTC
jgi:hypothetical protein